MQVRSEFRPALSPLTIPAWRNILLHMGLSQFSLNDSPSGPAPVYIGFGSLILDNPEKLTQDFLKVG